MILNSKDKKLIVIAGPTAVGKTHAAIELAQKLKTEIISADARQFYREMTIGTAKPSISELETVPHHFINNLSVKDEYNVGKYEQEVLHLISEKFKTVDHLILTGGSGLFIKAICEGLDEMPNIQDGLRQSLNKEYELNGIQPLLLKLQELDPAYYKIMDKNNPQRIIRALEVCISTHKTYSSFRKSNKAARDFQIIKVGLSLERNILYKRIDDRVDIMMKNGLLEEVKALIPFKNLNPLHTVGYTELFEYLDNKISLAVAVDEIKKNSRHYAKRQMTWFNKDPEFQWFDPSYFSINSRSILKL